jgi:hypothetical protein
VGRWRGRGGVHLGREGARLAQVSRWLFAMRVLWAGWPSCRAAVGGGVQGFLDDAQIEGWTYRRGRKLRGLRKLRPGIIYIGVMVLRFVDGLQRRTARQATRRGGRRERRCCAKAAGLEIGSRRRGSLQGG